MFSNSVDKQLANQQTNQGENITTLEKVNVYSTGFCASTNKEASRIGFSQ